MAKKTPTPRAAKVRPGTEAAEPPDRQGPRRAEDLAGPETDRPGAERPAESPDAYADFDLERFLDALDFANPSMKDFPPALDSPRPARRPRRSGGAPFDDLLSGGANNRPRPTNRRTQSDVLGVRRAIFEVLIAENPMTVRQVYYQLVSKGVIEKTENEYKQTVVRLLALMRRAGSIPFGWIADNTRWMRKPQTDSSLEAALRRTAEAYRRSVWDGQNAYVEVWLEKDALAGVLYDETASWDVPLMVTRGYPSLSYLHEAAEAIKAQGKPTYLYYFGDHDPSGLDIPRKVEEDIRDFAPGAEIHFEPVAVTAQQIEELGLPTRPTKKKDSRSHGFQGESVEVDAIPPGVLRDLVRDCIVRHVDQRALEVTRVAEASERQVLNRLAAMTDRGAPSFGRK
jgi:hypothetical protein